MAAAAAKKAAPRKAAPRKAAARPKAAEETPAAEAAGASSVLAKLYPEGTELFWFTTSDGTEIPFPKFAHVKTPTRRFFWELDQQPTVFQGFAWMRWAGVPVEVQSIAVDLADDEYDALFDAWFADAQLTAGE